MLYQLHDYHFLSSVCDPALMVDAMPHHPYNSIVSASQYPLMKFVKQVEFGKLHAEDRVQIGRRKMIGITDAFNQR